MKKRDSFSPPAIGGSSLLVIFGVLCLTVFALLSLSSVLAERRLADAAVQSMTDYYQADLRAEEIYARLRRGETVEGVREEAGICEFSVPISARQTLIVAVRKEQENWAVLCWQTVTAETEQDDSLDVWKGHQSKEEIP